MSSYRTSFIIAALMFAASIAAQAVRPDIRVAEENPVQLESMIPKEFGSWHEEPQKLSQVVNPQTQELLDKLYSQILTRVYVNADGYRIMLSLAYGSDQRGSLQAHKPEICYPAQGFNIEKNELGMLPTAFGTIPVRRLYGVMGARREPVTYWFTVGDQAVMSSTQKKLVELRFGLTGRIPDGMLFRVSSIDGDLQRAYLAQDRFVTELLRAVTTDDRKRLSGLDDQAG